MEGRARWLLIRAGISVYWKSKAGLPFGTSEMGAFRHGVRSVLKKDIESKYGEKLC